MNTDKQPQIEKTAAEFLFESGIDIMSLSDDFNCQLLFAMERYAEYYASHQKDIKIGDKVAFNYTDKQPQTIYTEQQVIAIIDEILEHSDCVMDAITNENTDFDGAELFNTVKNKMLKAESVYIFTFEQLEALLQKERREAAEKAMSVGMNQAHYSFLHPEQFKPIPIDVFIHNYLNQHYPLPQPPKQ